nr:unnamed protein product [Callosobruchus analis]
MPNVFSRITFAILRHRVGGQANTRVNDKYWPACQIRVVSGTGIKLLPKSLGFCTAVGRCIRQSNYCLLVYCSNA